MGGFMDQGIQNLQKVLMVGGIDEKCTPEIDRRGAVKLYTITVLIADGQYDLVVELLDFSSQFRVGALQ
jgi:hypothetical protein